LIEFAAARKVFVGPDGVEVVAVDSLDLRIAEGETHGLVGTSGCGKTTSMKMVNRLIEPTSGSVRVGGEEVTNLDPVLLRRRIGYVIQAGGLFPHMTVARNVGLLCDLEGWPRKKVDARTAELLALVNLPPEEFAHRYPGELSGGQRQRVGVARALALDPAYVLMDEPFGALDPITRAQIHEEFLALEEKVKKTVILVTHDMAEAFKLADRISLMDAGRLVFTGTEDEMRASDDPFVQGFVQGAVAS
jgi:osmoprotectant transport system ATP-binding protein